MKTENTIPAAEYLAYSIWRDAVELSKRKDVVLHESFKIILRDTAHIIERLVKE